MATENSDQCPDFEEQDENLSQERSNVVPEEKPSVFPNQQCIVDILFKHAVYSLEQQGYSLNDFKSVEFLVSKYRQKRAYGNRGLEDLKRI